MRRLASSTPEPHPAPGSLVPWPSPFSTRCPRLTQPPHSTSRNSKGRVLLARLSEIDTFPPPQFIRIIFERNWHHLSSVSHFFVHDCVPHRESRQLAVCSCCVDVCKGASRLRCTAFALSVWVSTPWGFHLYSVFMSWHSTLIKSFHFLFICLLLVWTHQFLFDSMSSNLLTIIAYFVVQIVTALEICFFLPHIHHRWSYCPCPPLLALKLQDHLDLGLWQVLLAF